MIKKIISFTDLKKIKLKHKKKKIGLAHGVFDLFHYGHLLHLEKAKSLCDILVISITSGSFVSKGPGRPFYSDDQRAKFLSSIEFIDYVLISNHTSGIQVIKKLMPNIYFKGDEYKNFGQDHTKKIEKEVATVKKYKGKVFFTHEPSMSSTKIINNFSDQLSDNLKKYLISLSKKTNFQKIKKIFDKIKKEKILVIGDVIMDKYIFTIPMGKSPKEQLISVKSENYEIYGGGIIATVNHLSSFTENCTLLTVLGNNTNENKKVKKFIDKRINSKFFYHKNISNLFKTRFIDKGNNKKLFQTANLDISLISADVEKKILTYLRKNINKFDQVIVHDFGHGLFTNKIINFLQKKSNFLSINVQTNSSNIGYNYITKYTKADYISIDEPEARLTVQDNSSSNEKLFYKIRKKIKFSLGAITLGKIGTKIFDNKKIHFAPALIDKPVDTLGAGDAHFAISSFCSKEVKNKEIIAFLGNVAGALKISYLGHRRYLNRVEFLNYIKSLLNI